MGALRVKILSLVREEGRQAAQCGLFCVFELPRLKDWVTVRFATKCHSPM